MVSQTTCRLWPGTIWGEIVPALALLYRPRRLLVGANVRRFETGTRTVGRGCRCPTQSSWPSSPGWAIGNARSNRSSP
jgi:hypothetical protein